VKVSQKVMVTVTEVDLPRKRIALSMKAAPEIGASSASTGPRTSPGAPRPAGGGFNRPSQPAKPAPVDWFTAALDKNKKH
jgi:uncharacterized protein